MTMVLNLPSSVPENANAAVTKTAHTPLKPLAKAPGFDQFCPPMKWS